MPARTTGPRGTFTHNPRDQTCPKAWLRGVGSIRHRIATGKEYVE